jgi:cyclic 2,3-diphosphoglycerate synthetase
MLPKRRSVEIKAVVLIDGEHYPPVILQAVREIQASGYEVVGAVFLGGTEKIENINQLNFGFPVFFSETDYISAMRDAIESRKPDIVLDLSDEPVLGYEERMFIASFLAAHGVDYAGSDFSFKAPSYEEPGSIDTVGVIGTGKRVGKTAVSAHLSRFLKGLGKKVVVLAMGRGGPEEPVVLDGENILIDNKFLLELKNAGKHAASDYVEDAMMSRVVTIGCRRCGGGFAGIPFVSNVREGFKVASSLKPDIIVLEGSGSSIPPIRAHSYLTVSSLIEPETHTIGYLGPYRLLISKVLLLTNCETAEEKRRYEKIEKEAKRINPELEVAGVVFRPKPLGSLKGEKVFLATTAHEKYNDYIARYLEETEGCTVVYSSNSLANRKKLREELEIKKREFTAVALELKAAAVDVVLDYAVANDKKAVFFDNIPHVVTSEQRIEEYFFKLLED